MKNRYLLFLLTLFIIWLYLFLYLNRYVIVSGAECAYKLNRINGESTILFGTHERNIKMLKTTEELNFIPDEKGIIWDK